MPALDMLVIRKTGGDISKSWIQYFIFMKYRDFNFTKSIFQLHKLTISTSKIHEFTFTNSRFRIQEFEISTSRFRYFIFMIHGFNFINNEVENFRKLNFVNSRTWNRKIGNLFRRNRKFVNLKLWNREVEFVNSRTWILKSLCLNVTTDFRCTLNKYVFLSKILFSRNTHIFKVFEYMSIFMQYNAMST